MYPVVLDSQIPQTTGQANGACSDIYFITTRISGQTVTWGQYQNFNTTYGSVRQEMVNVFGSDDIGITDNGRFAIVRDNSRASSVTTREDVSTFRSSPSRVLSPRCLGYPAEFRTCAVMFYSNRSPIRVVAMGFMSPMVAGV
jgi:hypothetical protein